MDSLRSTPEPSFVRCPSIPMMVCGDLLFIPWIIRCRTLYCSAGWSWPMSMAESKRDLGLTVLFINVPVTVNVLQFICTVLVLCITRPYSSASSSPPPPGTLRKVNLLRVNLALHCNMDKHLQPAAIRSSSHLYARRYSSLGRCDL